MNIGIFEFDAINRTYTPELSLLCKLYAYIDKVFAYLAP